MKAGLIAVFIFDLYLLVEVIRSRFKSKFNNLMFVAMSLVLISATLVFLELHPIISIVAYSLLVIMSIILTTSFFQYLYFLFKNRRRFIE